MANRFAILATLLLFSQIAFAQNNCQGIDLIYLFGGSSAASVSQTTTATLASNYGRAMRFKAARGDGAALYTNWVSSSSAFTSLSGIGTSPLTAEGIRVAYTTLVNEGIPGNRRVIVAYYSAGGDSLGNLVAYARQIKENATYPAEIFVVDYTNTLNVQDLASGGQSNGWFGNYYLAYSTYGNVDSAVAQSLSQKITRAQETASGTCWATGGLIGTFDTNSYNFPGYGEFQLLRTESDMNIQIRTESCVANVPPTTTTCIRSVAFAIGTNLAYISFEPAEGIMLFQTANTGATLYTTRNTGTSLYSGSLGFAGYTWTWDAAYLPEATEPLFTMAVTTGTGSSANIFFGKNTPGQVVVNLETGSFGRSTGLCGTWDSCKANDYWANNQGYVSSDAAPDAIFFSFANTWRVARTEDSYWYLPNDPRNKDYDMPLAPYSSNFQPAIVQNLDAAAGPCAMFSGASAYLYASCLYAETNGFPLVKHALALLLFSECRGYCVNKIEKPSSHINQAYCDAQCRRPTDLGTGVNTFPYYNGTALPPPTDVYNTNRNWQLWFSVGGTYTYRLTSSLCDSTKVGTINIVCDYTPTIDAGADRVVKKLRNYYPRVILRGTATDANTNRLQYYWSFSDYPRAVTTVGELTQFVPTQGYSSPPAALTNADTLYPSFTPQFPGDYVIQLKVFDGCSFSNDTVKITVQCEDCSLQVKTRYPSANTNILIPQLSSMTAGQTTFNSELSPNFQWFLTYNSRGWTSKQTTGGNRVYNLAYVPPEIISSSNSSLTSNTVSSTPFVPDVSPLSTTWNNVAYTRVEGTRMTERFVNTTTTVYTEYIYYSSVPVSQDRCQITLSNYNSATTTISYSDFWPSGDRFGLVGNRYCIGNYKARLDAVFDCLADSDNFDFSVQCGLSPRAHLVSCSKSLPYDYNAGAFPTFSLNAQDTLDADTTQGNLWFAWEVTSKPAFSGLPARLTSGCGANDGFNAVQGCTTMSLTPDYGGDYTITLRVTDTCTQDNETATFTVVCDPITNVAVVGATTYSDAADTPDYNRITLNSTFTSAHPIGVNWRFVSAPIPADNINFPGQAYDFRVHQEGTYVVELSANDGCHHSAVNFTFTYTCSTPIVPQVTSVGGTWNSGLGQFDPITFNASASTYLNTQGRSSLSFFRVSQPIGGGAPFNPALSGFGFTFVPSVPGVYNYSLTITDDCHAPSVTYWTFTTSPCPALPAITIAATPSASQALNYPVNNTVPFTIVTSAVVAPFVKTVRVISPTGGIFASGSDSFTYNAASVGQYNVTVSVSSDCVTTPVIVSTASLSVTCGITLSVPANPTASVTFVNGKFPRAYLPVTVTASDPSVNPNDYFSAPNGWTWEFTSAPTDSSFYFVADSTTTSTSSVGPVYNNYTVVNPDLWVSTITTTNTTVLTRNLVRVILNNGDNQNKFTACFAPDRPGTYGLKFSMTDFCGNVITATGTVTATCNGAPTAAAVNTTITSVANFDGYSKVVLDGRASTDPENDPLYYSWTFVSVPTGSSWNGSVPNANLVPVAYFVPDRAGVYQLMLTVHDGCSISTQMVTVTASCVIADFATPTITFAHDGMTPVSLTHFILAANPMCQYGYSFNLDNYVPAPYNMPAPPAPAPTDATAGASTVAASLLALVMLVLALVF